MEDTLAAREVVLWCIQRPQELASWGLVKKEEEEQRQRKELEKAQKLREAREETKRKEEAEKREETQKASLATTASKEGETYSDYSSDLDEDEMRTTFCID